MSSKHVLVGFDNILRFLYGSAAYLFSNHGNQSLSISLYLFICIYGRNSCNAVRKVKKGKKYEELMAFWGSMVGITTIL